MIFALPCAGGRAENFKAGFETLVPDPITISVAKGLDVDKPRNLAKSVTVE